MGTLARDVPSPKTSANRKVKSQLTYRAENSAEVAAN